MYNIPQSLTSTKSRYTHEEHFSGDRENKGDDSNRGESLYIYQDYGTCICATTIHR